MKQALVLVFAGLPLFAQSGGLEFLNGNKPVVDAHNCYPYNGQWADRLSRALGSGYPKGIEQDLAWSVDATTGKGRVVLSHSEKTTGGEPSDPFPIPKRIEMLDDPLLETARSSFPSRLKSPVVTPAGEFPTGKSRAA